MWAPLHAPHGDLAMTRHMCHGLCQGWMPAVPAAVFQTRSLSWPGTRLCAVNCGPGPIAPALPS